MNELAVFYEQQSERLLKSILLVEICNCRLEVVLHRGRLDELVRYTNRGWEGLMKLDKTRTVHESFYNLLPPEFHGWSVILN